MHQAVVVIAKYGIAVPIISYLILLARQRRNAQEILLFTFVSTVLAVVLIKLATTLHSDPRPFVRDGVTPYFRSATDNGFPSDHTALSSVIAFIVFAYNKPAGLLLVAGAAAIGAARVLAGVHHGQDVIGAIVIAAISVYLAKLATKKLIQLRQHKTPNNET